jgi:hypothetical protein
MRFPCGVLDSNDEINVPTLRHAEQNMKSQKQSEY